MLASKKSELKRRSRPDLRLPISADFELDRMVKEGLLLLLLGEEIAGSIDIYHLIHSPFIIGVNIYVIWPGWLAG